MKNKSIDLIKLIKIELKTQVTPAIVFIALLFAFVSMINPMVSNASDYTTIRDTWQFLGRVFTEAFVYALAIRFSSFIMNKHSVDKNRAEYIVFSKIKVLLAKSLVDVFLFLILILTSIIGNILIIYYWKNGKFSSDFVFNTISFIIGISSFYFFMATGIRLITSAKKLSNVIKFFLLLAWIILTLLTYLILSVLIGVLKYKDGTYVNSYGIRQINYKYPIRTFFMDSHKWSVFVPFLNIGIISMILYGFIDWYFIFPLVFHFIIFFIFVSQKLSTNWKEYLTT